MPGEGSSDQRWERIWENQIGEQFIPSVNLEDNQA
jgi:hypothetical protein